MQLDLVSNDLVTEVNGELLVSSFIISENVGNEHSTVLRLIRDNLQDFEEFGRVRFENQPFNTNGGIQNRRIALLNENQSMLIMTYMRNNEIVKRFKISLIKAFSLMKQKIQQQKFQIPQTFSEALLLASKQAEQIELQQKQLQEQKPKVEFFEAVTGSKDTIDMGSVAKVLNKKIGRNKLFEFLRNKGVLMSNNIPYQKYCDSGYFRVIETKYTKPDGSTHIGLKTLVYQKGVNYINKLLEK